MRLAVDVMGGDREPAELVAAARAFAADHPGTRLLIAATPDVAANERAGGLQWRLCEQVVEMTDRPAHALRSRAGSTLHAVIECVADGEADACVSAGNTGALMAVGRHMLGTLPGISRPAIVKAMPSIGGRSYVLDLGANVGADAGMLEQFAAMGQVLCAALEGKARPRVALLNIGAEDGKGGAAMHEAAGRLSSHPDIHFCGFVEGDAIFRSGADVIVCDGFVGNIALKTSEGLARFVAHLIDDAFSETWLTRMVALAASPVLRRLSGRLDPEQYNGAMLIGLRQVVVKSHGAAGGKGFYQALVEAMRAVERQVPDLVERRLALNPGP